MKNDYDDIINLPHHVSSTRPQMSMIDRAAQFSPFAALTGYDAAIKETGRLTDEKIELDEEALSNLNMKFQILFEKPDTFFAQWFANPLALIFSEQCKSICSYFCGIDVCKLHTS